MADGIPSGDLVRKFQQALPRVRAWVETTIAAHRELAIPVSGVLITIFAFDAAIATATGRLAGEEPADPSSKGGA